MKYYILLWELYNIFLTEVGHKYLVYYTFNVISDAIYIPWYIFLGALYNFSFSANRINHADIFFTMRIYSYARMRASREILMALRKSKRTYRPWGGNGVQIIVPALTILPVPFPAGH